MPGVSKVVSRFYVVVTQIQWRIAHLFAVSRSLAANFTSFHADNKPSKLGIADVEFA